MFALIQKSESVALLPLRGCCALRRRDRNGAEKQWTSQCSEGLMAALNNQGAHAVSTTGIESHLSDNATPPRYGWLKVADSQQMKRLDGDPQISRAPGFRCGEESGAEGTAGVS